MKLLTKIANSRPVQSYFRCPSVRSLKVFALVVTILALVSVLQSAYHAYQSSTVQGADLKVVANAVFSAVVITFALFAYVALIFVLVWRVLYRVATNAKVATLSFINWAPAAWSRFRLGVRFFVKFVARVPAIISQGFRTIGAGLKWLADRPRWWRSLDKDQRSKVWFNVGFLFTYAGTIVAVFPVAAKISSVMPKWMIMHEAPLLQTLYIDFVLGSVAAAVIMAVIMAVIDTVIAALKCAIRH